MKIVVKREISKRPWCYFKNCFLILVAHSEPVSQWENFCKWNMMKINVMKYCTWEKLITFVPSRLLMINRSWHLHEFLVLRHIMNRFTSILKYFPRSLIMILRNIILGICNYTDSKSNFIYILFSLIISSTLISGQS